MNVLFRLVTLALFAVLGITSACAAPQQPMTPAENALPATSTITVTDYDPPLPFTMSIKPYEVLECSYSVLSQDSDRWEFGWKLILGNNTGIPLLLQVTMQLLYETGYQVTADKIPEAISLAPWSRETFTGSLTLNAHDARQVRSLTAFMQ